MLCFLKVLLTNVSIVECRNHVTNLWYLHVLSEIYISNKLKYRKATEQLFFKYLWTCSNVIKGLMTKSREHSNFIFVSTWHVRCCETETFLWMSSVNYTSDPIINSSTQKPLNSFSSGERTAEDSLHRNGKLIIILWLRSWGPESNALGSTNLLAVYKWHPEFRLDCNESIQAELNTLIMTGRSRTERFSINTAFNIRKKKKEQKQHYVPIKLEFGLGPLNLFRFCSIFITKKLRIILRCWSKKCQDNFFCWPASPGVFRAP